jgi:RND family efflux transporter MFP subunit
MKRDWCLLLLLLLPMGGAGCGRGAEGSRTAERPAVAVETAPVTFADLQETVEVVGTLEPKFEAFVKAEYPGTITEVNVTEWVRIKKGTVLARLDTRELEAAVQASKASLLQAEVTANRAGREFERAKNLKQAGLMTRQGVEDAETSDRAAAAQLEAARAQLRAAETRLAKAVVRSPMDGVVARRDVSVGDMAGGDPLFRIVDTSVLDVTVAVPATEIHAVKVGQPLSFTTESVPGRSFEGTVAFINPAADMASRTVKVVAEVPNQDEVLRAGFFVRGSVRTAERPGVLLLPRTALLGWDIQARTADVFVVEDGLARRRSIQTGRSAGEQVEVTGGVDSGEQVVTRGGFLLRDGDRVAVVSASEQDA